MTQSVLVSTIDANLVHLVVRDSGAGIPPDALPHIFDRRYRVARARQNGSELGLGLAIARSLVSAHGGEITVTSTLGAGTVFTIRLPAAIIGA